MPGLKYPLLDEMKRLSGRDGDSTLFDYLRAWSDLQILRGLYDAARLAGVASPCSCGRHHATADGNGNLFYAVVVSPREFQRIKDGRYLPAEIAETVQGMLAETTHPSADVVVVARDTAEPFHLVIDRNGYTIRQTNHVVKEAQQ